jgi:hypothetical protein
MRPIKKIYAVAELQEFYFRHFGNALTLAAIPLVVRSVPSFLPSYKE